MTDEQLLAHAAAALGLEPSYTDTWGKEHETTPDAARAILRALGIASGSNPEIEQALAQRAAREWQQALDPTLVVRKDCDAIRLRVPAAREGAAIKLEIQWEDGELQHHWYWLPELAMLETAVIGGSSWIAKRLPLPPLRLGYHQLRVYWVREPELEVLAEARLIVCPHRAKAVEQRMAGLALSLYGVRSARNWGCGDFTDLEAVIAAFAPAGAAFLALNPLHALANRAPYNTSPYLPQCALYRNFIYLDVDKVGPTSLNAEMQAEIVALRASQFVEYERVARLKLAALRGIFERFLSAGGDAAFDDYCVEQGGPLQDYAVYCALDEEMHRRDPNVWLWTQWPAPYQEPRSPAVEQFAEDHRTLVQFHQFLQWHIARQAAAAHAYALAQGMAIGIYHDLALATDKYGADLWAARSFYVSGCKVGAPPDELAPSGQDWGFPPPNREAHRRDGYRLFAQSIRNAASCGGALRIDHVMRFLRLYWIPDGLDASQGAYVREYAEELLGVLALESVRGNFIIVGEDLGTVTDEARRGLSGTGVLSYRVLWFERREDGEFRLPGEYSPGALVCATTHDLPTLSGFASARDLEARKIAGLADEDEYQRQKAARTEEVARLERALADAGFVGDPLGFLLATPCLLAAVNQEDLTGETEQQNLPGSTWQYPNWSRKMLVPVEQFAPLAEKFAHEVRRSGRTISG